MPFEGEIHERIQRHDTDTHLPQLLRDLRQLLLPHRERLRVTWRVPVDCIPIVKGAAVRTREDDVPRPEICSEMHPHMQRRRLPV